MSQNLIFDDQYTRDGYIAAIDRLHEELAFRFRPMLPEQVEDLEQSLEKAAAVKAAHLVAAALARQLMEWSEVDRAGAPAAIEFGTLRRLPYALLVKLRRVVTGQGASDLRPQATVAETAAYAQDLAVEINGQPPGIIRLENDQKNCTAG